MTIFKKFHYLNKKKGACIILVVGRRFQEKIHCEIQVEKLIELALARASARTGKDEARLLASDMLPSDYAGGFDIQIVDLRRTKARIGLLDNQQLFHFDRDDREETVQQENQASAA